MSKSYHPMRELNTNQGCCHLFFYITFVQGWGMNSGAVSNLSRFISATKGYHFLLHLTHCTLLMSSSCFLCSVERILTSCTSSAWLKLKLKIWVKGQKTRLDFSTIEWLRISNVCRKEVCSSYAMTGLPLLSSGSTTPQGVLCWSILISDYAQCKTTWHLYFCNLEVSWKYFPRTFGFFDIHVIPQHRWEQNFPCMLSSGPK